MKEGEIKMNFMLGIADRIHSAQGSWGHLKEGMGYGTWHWESSSKGNLEKPGRAKNYSEATIQDVSQLEKANLII